VNQGTLLILNQIQHEHINPKPLFVFCILFYHLSDYILVYLTHSTTIYRTSLGFQAFPLCNNLFAIRRMLHIFLFKWLYFVYDRNPVSQINRKVIHTVGPKYASKYHTAAENALSHCYRSCLEMLIDLDLKRFTCLSFLLTLISICEHIAFFDSTFGVLCVMCSIAFGCIYTEANGYPREEAAHVAISKFTCQERFVYMCFCIDHEDYFQELYAGF
jgi:hypothetical protein